MNDYYALRAQVAKLVPRTVPLFGGTSTKQSIKEKGRKKGYKEFKLPEKEWTDHRRLLRVDHIGSFVEVSCRAAACPMPLNLDVWDGLRCPFGCKYCYADSFKGTLYTSFFDNAKSVGVRHCDPDYVKKQLDKLMAHRGNVSNLSGGTLEGIKRRLPRVSASGTKFDSRGGASGWQACKGASKAALDRAVALEIPMRLGIRYEDFTKSEQKLGISLSLLNYLADQSYPVMINTKSDLVGEDEYVEALARNSRGAAVHLTMISSNNDLLKVLEPGAPSYKRRIWAMKQLADAGVRPVLRIEPFLLFLSDPPDEVERFAEDLSDAGVKHITFDTYSWTAKNPGIRRSFYDLGIDWDRLFLLGCDSQGLGSLLLGEFMKIWRGKGFSCSTFDMGNVPDNDQAVCCEVGDLFEGSGFNYGCSVMAGRFVSGRKGKHTSWKDFVDWVNTKGGFLSESLRVEVHKLWNMEGNSSAYSHGWARGLVPVGQDESGLIWAWEDTDFRRDLLAQLDW